MEPPPAVQLLVAFFRQNPDFFKLPGLFDATFERQEFEELDLLLSQNYISFPRRFGEAYFLAAYFKSYFKRLLLGINNSLIPTDQYEAHSSLDGLADEE